MSERIVSAEEARKLLEGATPGTWIDFGDKEPYPGEVVCYGDADNGRLTRICRDPDMDDRPGDRRLIAAAPDLARTVARLQDILDCETGKRAPEGWESMFAVDYEGDDELREAPYTTRWRRIADGIHCYAGHSENTHPKCWWCVHDRRSGIKIVGSGEAESLLEAIEAADRAAKVNP